MKTDCDEATPAGDDEAEAVEAMEAVEAEATWLAGSEDGRNWLLVLNKLTEQFFDETAIPPSRVRVAYLRYLEAAFDRAYRILRSDLPEG